MPSETKGIGATATHGSTAELATMHSGRTWIRPGGMAKGERPCLHPTRSRTIARAGPPSGRQKDWRSARDLAVGRRDRPVHTCGGLGIVDGGQAGKARLAHQRQALRLAPVTRTSTLRPDRDWRPAMPGTASPGTTAPAPSPPPKWSRPCPSWQAAG